MPPTVSQTPTEEELWRISTARQEPTRSNPVINGLDIHRRMVAANQGYPMHLYHPTAPPQVAINEQQETQYRAHGYTERYIEQKYPKVLYRRNPTPRFAKADIDPARGVPINEGMEGIETRTVKSEGDERALKALRVGPGYSQWVPTLADLPELDAVTEDPKETILKLEAALEEARRMNGGKPGKEK